MSVNTRTTIFVMAASQAEALALAPQVSQPSLVMFPLVPSSGPATAAATAYGACGRLHGWDATIEAANAATLAAAAPSFPGCFFWRGSEVDSQSTLVEVSSNPEDVGKRLSFAQMLTEAGLQIQRKAFP